MQGLVLMFGVFAVSRCCKMFFHQPKTI
ncbi:AgrD family cyclic lactone autoinducer peptide [Dolichospermum planctonicum]